MGEIFRITFKIAGGSEEGVTSAEIFESQSERYIATIGRDALDLGVKHNYFEKNMGLYKLTSGGRSTFSYDSLP